MAKQIFCRKPYGQNLYRWSPDASITKIVNDTAKETEVEYCTATPYSMGEDYKTKYCYRTIEADGKIKKLAYVTCGYVN